MIKKIIDTVISEAKKDWDAYQSYNLQQQSVLVLILGLFLLFLLILVGAPNVLKLIDAFICLICALMIVLPIFQDYQ